MWTIFKVFFEFVTILLMFYGFFFFFFFGYEACEILSSWSGIESTPPALEGQV